MLKVSCLEIMVSTEKSIPSRVLGIIAPEVVDRHAVLEFNKHLDGFLKINNILFKDSEAALFHFNTTEIERRVVDGITVRSFRRKAVEPTGKWDFDFYQSSADSVTWTGLDFRHNPVTAGRVLRADEIDRVREDLELVLGRNKK